MSQVKIQGNAGGSGSVTITSPNTNSAYTQTLLAQSGTIPVTSSNVALVTGVAMYENIQTIGTSYSITSGSSAVSAGPVTISTGYAVTIPAGSKWVIL